MGSISELIRIVIYVLLSLFSIAIVVIAIGGPSRWLASFEQGCARVLDPLLDRFTRGCERTVSPQDRATNRICIVLFLLAAMELLLVMLLHVAA